jgi:hypothetical protein
VVPQCNRTLKYNIIDYSNYTFRRVQVMKLLIMQFSPTSSLFGSNILLNTLFSNTLNLCSSLNIRDQVSQPYRTTGKIIDYNTGTDGKII